MKANVSCVSTDEGASAAQPLIRGRAYRVSHSTKIVRDKVNLYHYAKSKYVRIHAFFSSFVFWL